MKRVFASAAAAVIGITLFAGLGSSVASASESGQFRSLNDRRMHSWSGFKATRFATLSDRRHKGSSKAVIDRDAVTHATGR